MTRSDFADCQLFRALPFSKNHASDNYASDNYASQLLLAACKFLIKSDFSY